MTTKTKTPRLTEERRCLFAALLATSNMGLDLPKDLERQKKCIARSRQGLWGGISLETWMADFCGHYAETDQMFEDMMGEAKAWYRDLKTYTEDKVAKTWPDIAKLVGAP